MYHVNQTTYDLVFNLVIFTNNGLMWCMAIMDFTRPLWAGHYGLCFNGHSIGQHGHKGQH